MSSVKPQGAMMNTSYYSATASKTGARPLGSIGESVAAGVSSGIILLGACALGAAGMPVAAVVAGLAAASMVLANTVKLSVAGMGVAARGINSLLGRGEPGDETHLGAGEVAKAAQVSAASTAVGLTGVAIIGAAALAPALLGFAGVVGLAVSAVIAAPGLYLVGGSALDSAPGGANIHSDATDFVLKKLDQRRSAAEASASNAAFQHKNPGV